MKKLLLLLCIFCLTGCTQTVDLSAASDISATALASKYSQASEVKSKYQLINTALKMTAKADPKDTIKVTVGSDEVLLGGAGEFEPSVKISRWDEVSLKLTPKGLDKIANKDKKLSFEGDKIKFKTPKVDYKMYDLPETTGLEEGGYEYEVILKEKPITNVVEFDIETKGLDFFYQPPLTEEYKDGYNEEFQKDIVVSDTDVKDKDGNGLVHRPENVVGAYAVYASENKINYVGGKEYKTGQIGMLYRPKIIDSVGNWVWGELGVDIESGILSVTIPNDFLDKAVYPVRHAAGLTFGYTTAGSTEGTFYANRLLGSVFTSDSTSGTIDSITFYLRGVSTSARYKGVIILHSDLTIITNGVGGEVYGPGFFSKAWKTSTFSTPPTVSGSTDYVLMSINNYTGSNSGLMYNSGDANQGHEDETNSYTTPANPGTVTHSTNKYSIYATYTAAAATPSTDNGTIIIFD